MLKLLIAVDGSEPARHAIEAAGNLARVFLAVDVLLVHVRVDVASYGLMPAFDVSALEGAERSRQHELLDTALAQAQACGLARVATVATVGAPAQEIVRIATERQVDQIVMGTRGMNALAGLMLGSVAQRVTHLADRPVLLVK